MEFLNIGSRREVFWDDYMIDTERTTAFHRVIAYGYIYVDVLDERGNVLSENQSCKIFGNNIDRIVRFADGKDFAAYEGKPIRLRFRMRDAQLFSMIFV